LLAKLDPARARDEDGCLGLVYLAPGTLKKHPGLAFTR
jgi:hypothetical protein